jgi:hypothetical protein
MGIQKTAQLKQNRNPPVKNTNPPHQLKHNQIALSQKLPQRDVIIPP